MFDQLADYSMRLKNNKLLSGLIISWVLLIPACGYHLRGSYEVPQALKSVFLQCETKELRDQFKKVIQSSAGQVLDTPEKAGIVVRVFNERMHRRVLSLSARGRANEFELHYQMEYELANAANAILSPRQPLEIRREYFNDQQDIIAKDFEEKIIRDEMYQQAVRTVITRARVVLEAKSK